MELTETGRRMPATAIWPASRRRDGDFRIIRRVRDRCLELRARRALRDLDQLDDRLLRDVGLRREHFPGGVTRSVRF